MTSDDYDEGYKDGSLYMKATILKLIDEKIDNLNLENWWTEQDDIKKALEELKKELKK